MSQHLNNPIVTNYEPTTFPAGWVQHPWDGGVGPEPRPSTEDMIREIHGWLSEIMPAARVAVKMMDARTSLMKRWRGGHDAK